MRKLHSVYRVPGFLSSRPDWVPPHPHLQESDVPPLWVQGGDTLARGEGMGGPDSDDGTDTLHGTLDILYYNIILLRIAPNICKKYLQNPWLMGTAFR